MRHDRFRGQAVRVRPPATSANLGPGFDALGVALDLHDEIEAAIAGTGVSVDVHGQAAEDVPRGESHLIVRAMRATFDTLGQQPPGLALRCRNRVPHGRGLGSSAAAIVAGVVAARTLTVGGPVELDDLAALRLAADLEGHPDNVAACLLGGLTIAWNESDGAHALRLEPSARAVVMVPPDPVTTAAARGLLPEQVPHADAARNAGRAALLVAALTSGAGRDQLLAGTEDWLHQAYREPAMSASVGLVRALRADGIPATISGAGPTVLSLLPASTDSADVRGRTPSGWECYDLSLDLEGAVVSGMPGDVSTLEPM